MSRPIACNAAEGTWSPPPEAGAARWRTQPEDSWNVADVCDWQVTGSGHDQVLTSNGVDLGIINETTARGLFVLLNAIARGTAVSKSASERMVAVLAAQKFNDGIPKGVPPGTKVAHKTGTITRVHHDAAIVYGERPCVLVVLTRGIEKEADSDALIARITRALLP